jgi:hypothetical protein
VSFPSRWDSCVHLLPMATTSGACSPRVADTSYPRLSFGSTSHRLGRRARAAG